jgi:hypothetical protein
VKNSSDTIGNRNHELWHLEQCLKGNYDTNKKKMEVTFHVLIQIHKEQSILLGGWAAGVSLGDV